MTEQQKHCPNFQARQLASAFAGPRLLVLGAVHGNEVCGTQGIGRVLCDFDSGALQLVRGRVTFVPVTNPLAYQLGQRSGERNLNRNLSPTAQPQEFEDHIANWLCPLMAQHDVLLDLHSFQGQGQAFVMVGPQNNEGALEPFAQAEQEVALALRLGVNRFVDGWLSTYARGVEQRRARMGPNASRQDLLNMDARYGVGTTEYMRSVGGYALTLECGNHADPLAPEVATLAICNTLAHLGLIATAAPEPASHTEALRIYDVIDRVHTEDAFSRTWASFDPLKRGELIGTRADGTPVLAPDDGYILFPAALAAPGQEWFYLARASGRL
ncbi:MAG: succinylglutamate desuccinylase/aspartoacylase family protein [Betaproteobacteria bacterium]